VEVQYINKKKFRKPKYQNKTIPGDYAIITPTSKIVSQLEFEPPLLFTKLNALNSIFYFNSAKLFLNFKSPLWNTTTDNKIPRIPFDD
jgi:monoamine oxidase